jgi:hypothetical protein
MLLLLLLLLLMLLMLMQMQLMLMQLLLLQLPMIRQAFASNACQLTLNQRIIFKRMYGTVKTHHTRRVFLKYPVPYEQTT